MQLGYVLFRLAAALYHGLQGEQMVLHVVVEPAYVRVCPQIAPCVLHLVLHLYLLELHLGALFVRVYISLEKQEYYKYAYRCA